MTQIKKAVILTAGLGSRFLPMTKVIPKAMLPIIDKPVIQYLVEEAVASGITEIIFVNSRGHHAIEDHFTHSHELASELTQRGKTDLLKQIEEIEKLAHFSYTMQEELLGDGHAILSAKNLIGDEPFAVLFGDDIIDNDVPALKQMLALYEKTGAPVICSKRVPKDSISLYGVIDAESVTGKEIKVKGLVEKPKQEEAPSEYGIIGKYICTPEILTYLEKSSASHSDGQIRLIDGFIALLADEKPLYALEVEGDRYDTGNKLGLLKANIAYALKDPHMKAHIKAMLGNLTS